MKKIKEFFKKLDLKNNPNTVLAIIIEIILISDVVVGAIKGVTLFGYICVVLIAMMYVGLAEYNNRRYLNLKNKK